MSDRFTESSGDADENWPSRSLTGLLWQQTYITGNNSDISDCLTIAPSFVCGNPGPERRHATAHLRREYEPEGDVRCLIFREVLHATGYLLYAPLPAHSPGPTWGNQ